MKVLFFDLETRKLAQELRPDNTEEGWNALRQGEGGISSLIIYDTEDAWLHIYDDQSIQTAARHLESGDVIVGFRSEKFDIPVIEGVLNRKLAIRYHYDIYSEIARANAKKGIVGRLGDLTLDTICRRCFGRGKTDSGAHAPELIKQGKIAELYNYCSNDVHLTYDLFQFICQHGGVNNINNSFLGLSVPDWVKRGMN